MDCLHLWYNHAADVVPDSTALAFIIKMSEKHKSTSCSAIQVKSWRNKIGIEEKLDIISWLEKAEWIVDICHNVRFAHVNVRTISGNAGRMNPLQLNGKTLSP